MVIGASAVIEAAVAGLYAVVGIVTSGLVRAVVISLPNAVGAVYLAQQGHGAEHSLNSNAINVLTGLLSPASLADMDPGRDAAARCPCRAPTAPCGRARGEHRPIPPTQVTRPGYGRPSPQLAQHGRIHRVPPRHLREAAPRPEARTPGRTFDMRGRHGRGT